ncbi:immune inhibitor A domain-containing protein [Aeromicrobium piscarium]|nr:immune inhibitor A domain-containing protein [Aeromicrobium piscarium]
MKRIMTSLVGLGLVATGSLVAAAPTSADPAPPASPGQDGAAPRTDDFPHPLEDKRRELREAAVSQVIDGELTPEQREGGAVAKVGQAPSPAQAAAEANGHPQTQQRLARASGEQDQYVELEQERADKVFVILAEFDDERHPDYPDQDTDPDTPGPERFDGPLHNQIPEPGPNDNSTVWQEDFSPEHYDDMYFATGQKTESVKTYYETQSSGRYTVDGQVSDWVKVPYNQARYGREDAGAWNLVQDAVNQWVEDQKAQGRSDEDIAKTLSEYDQWDRYDYDGDGVFDEPDGYIDHFQIVHAGGGEEDGDPTYGEDAIWSHRWYAFGTDAGLTGPADNPLGGAEIGDTGVWVGDYTVQPENGGLSVFVHEYGHDLGLPDGYDTTGAGDNSNEFWTLMAQSRLNAKGEPLGTRPGDLGAWEKLQLGWLDYEAQTHTEKRTLELGPQEYNSDKPQGAVVVLPKKEIVNDNGAPASGEKQFFSGAGDDLSNTMTTELDLGEASGTQLTAKARFSIEEGYDYAYLQASADGTSWTDLDATIGGEPIGADASGRPAIDGEQEDWADLVVPLDAFDGQQISFRVLYRTDGGLTMPGLFLDDIVVSAGDTEILSDDAETDSGAWTFDGFSIVGETTTTQASNYYVMGHRSYTGYDQYLKTGPYNFGFMDTKPDWVEHYAYQTGLLVSYWDTSQADNNVSQHPGEGRNLIVDANPRPMINIVTGEPWRARIQMYDAPFSTRKSDSMTLHTDGQPSYIRGQAAKPVFDDTKQYFFEELPNHGVKLPATGFKARVLEENGTSLKVRFN